jgi:hypothetical protein
MVAAVNSFSGDVYVTKVLNPIFKYVASGPVTRVFGNDALMYRQQLRAFCYLEDGHSAIP